MKRSHVAMTCVIVLALVALAGVFSNVGDPLAGSASRLPFGPGGSGPVVSGGAGAEAADEVADEAGASSGSEPSYEAGMALVMLEEDADPEAVFGRIAEVPELEGVSVARVTDGCMKIALPEGLAVEDAVELLPDAAGVAAAQPNYRYHVLGEIGVTDTVQMLTTAALSAADGLEGVKEPAQAAANDPRKSEQWALSSMNVPAAWNTTTALGASHKRVSVAILDSGFLVSHEDLENVVVKTYNAVNGGSNVYNSAGNAAHGTHVAGTIAAQVNNGKGIAGVAYNTSSFTTCKLVPIQVATKQGSIYTDTLVDAYGWLRKKRTAYNIRVVNMSLGGDRGMDKEYGDTLLERSMSAAWDEGIVTVAAAGNINDGRSYEPFATWPSDSPNVVSVMNLAQSSNVEGVARASSSNFNVYDRARKDISAPGSGILSAYSSSVSGYARLTGTSMASPAVAGVLALEFKANPKLTAPEAASKLFSTAKDLTQSWGSEAGWDRTTGYGEADAAAAVSASAAYLSGATTVSAGRYSQLSVKIGGKKQPAGAWRWSSSDASIARVSSTGCVTGVSAGDVVITATNGAKTACQTMTVSGSKTHVSGLSIKLSNRVYTGKARTPAPAVRDGSVKLVKGRHYKVSYSNNRKVGVATAKVTGIAPYYGSTTRRFTIKPKATSITSLKRSSRGFAAKWKKRTAQTTGYQLQIATNKRFTQGRYTFRKANVNATEAKLGNLKAKRRYYVRVRTYKVAGGRTYYSSWSKAKSVKTK